MRYSMAKVMIGISHIFRIHGNATFARTFCETFKRKLDRGVIMTWRQDREGNVWLSQASSKVGIATSQ